jgi:hypothetical protein
MLVLITVRNVYGKETIYPANETARIFTSIAGKKTLDHADLKSIQALGYEIKVEPNQLVIK